MICTGRARIASFLPLDATCAAHAPLTSDCICVLGLEDAGMVELGVDAADDSDTSLALADLYFHFRAITCNASSAAKTLVIPPEMLLLTSPWDAVP